MPSLFNYHGYLKNDPFDRMDKKWSTLLFFLSTLLFFGLFYWLIVQVIPILTFRNQPIKWLFVVVLALVFGGLVKLFRKSSSLFLMALIGLPLFLLDLYFAGNYVPSSNNIAWWDYQPNSFLATIDSKPLKIFVWNLITACYLGPIVLWLNRLVALPFAQKSTVDKSATTATQLFQEKWVEQPIPSDKKARKDIKPVRKLDFHFLRAVGLVYFFYLIILWLGWISHGENGKNLWPAGMQSLFDESFRNPIHGLNFMGKMVMMSLLGLLAAYNKPIRWYGVLALGIGHLISTILIGIFYFLVETTPQKELLVPAGILDIVLSIGFFVVLYLLRKENRAEFQKVEGLPLTFSTPYSFNTILFYGLAGLFLSYFGLLLYARFVAAPDSAIKVLFYAEDFIAYNSMTYTGTLALLAFLCARSERLQHYLLSTVVNPLFFSWIFGFIWFISGDMITEQYYFYFLLFFVGSGFLVGLIHILRKLRYNVDFLITALHPSEAMTAEAVVKSLYWKTPVDSKGSLKELDNYISNIRGRKRGLVNFPFWILENIISPLWGLRPYFSLMDTSEQTYFLRKKVLRLPLERKKAFAPALAKFAFKMGISIKALATFAHFSTDQGKKNTNYIAPEYRAQFTNCNTYQPDTSTLLPRKLAEDSYFEIEKNYQKEQNIQRKKVGGNHAEGTKLSTELLATDNYDYIIIGSGAAGGVMAYRLATSGIDPKKIALIERGKRHSSMNSMTDNELEMFAKLYKEGGLQQTKNFDMTVLQAECLGGTTVVNNAVCFETPDHIIEYWTKIYGLNLTDLKEEMKKIGREIHIHELKQTAVNQLVTEKFFKGIDTYNNIKNNEKLDKIPAVKVNAIDELGDGLWNLGNKRKRKLTMTETYIKWAEQKGVHILEETNAVRFFTNKDKGEKGPYRATKLLIQTKDKQFKKIAINKKLIIAGGCLASSHLLMRSNITKNVGNQMSCNYALSFAFKYKENINAFEGAQITAAAIDKHLKLENGKEKHLIFETYFNPPASFALTLPFNFEINQDILQNYHQYLNFGILIGSENSGKVLPKPNYMDGRAFVWPLSPEDVPSIKRAFKIIIELGRHSGAEKVIIPLQPGIILDLTNEEEIAAFYALWDNYPLTKLDINLNTSHPQGGNLMAGSNSTLKKERVVDEQFKVENHTNVHVVDASIFPTSLGVNPQWTVMGMSSLASREVLKD